MDRKLPQDVKVYLWLENSLFISFFSWMDLFQPLNIEDCYKIGSCFIVSGTTKQIIYAKDSMPGVKALLSTSCKGQKSFQLQI